MLGDGIGCLIPALLSVELHAQECFLLLGSPAKSIDFRARARIQAKKKLLIFRLRCSQAVIHLVAILLDSEEKERSDQIHEAFQSMKPSL